MMPVDTESAVQDSRPATAENSTDSRRLQRISLPLPARVEVLLDKGHEWSEMTRLIDVSAFGAGFVLKRPLKRGRLIMLTLPMPRQLRSFDYSEPQYRIWALVRRCIPIGGSVAADEFAIGTAFTGKHPPQGFRDDPSRLYDITRREESGGGFWHVDYADLRVDDSGLPAELRKQTRFSIPEPLKIEQTDEAGNVIFSEPTVSENLSLGGASVFSTLQAPAGTFVRVSSERFDVTILAIVRGRRLGTDGIPRLHLEFIDRLFPLQGIVNQ